MTDREKFQKTFSHLHASDGIIQEVLDMKETEHNTTGRRAGRRTLVAVLAAVLALGLGVTVLAAAGVFSMKSRPAERNEQFRLNFVEDQELYWKDAKLVFNFDGPETANKIRFRPGYLPCPATVLSEDNSDGWFTRLTTEGGMEGISQPCLIEVYYAPQYIHGGNLILLYDEPGEMTEETWGGLQVTKFETTRTIPGTEYREEMVLPGSYVLLYHPEEGYLIVVSGQSDLPTLERVARELEIEPTGEVITSAGCEGENRFIDWGVG